MAKLKRASASVAVPRDGEEAAVWLQRIGEAVRACTLIETEMNRQLADIKSEAEAEARPHQAAIAQMTQGLQVWAEGNRAALTRNGATKTVRLGTAGELAWRTRPPSVRITGVDAVIEALARLGLDRFLRTKTKVDKEAMLREPAEAGRVPGVRVASEGEEFVVTPANVALETSGAAVAA